MIADGPRVCEHRLAEPSREGPLKAAGEEDITDMKRRHLGKSGLTVSEICMGTMTFGNQSDEPTSRAILDRAYDRGVDFLDVAEVYPVPPEFRYAGASEEIVGRWMSADERRSPSRVW